MLVGKDGFFGLTGSGGTAAAVVAGDGASAAVWVPVSHTTVGCISGQDRAFGNNEDVIPKSHFIHKRLASKTVLERAAIYEYFPKMAAPYNLYSTQ